MQAFAGMLAGDPTKAYQQSAGRQQALNATQSEIADRALLGTALQDLIQSPTPFAGPMPGGPPGMGQMPMGLPQGGMPQQPSGGPPLQPGGPSAGGPPPTALAGASGMTPPGGGPSSFADRFGEYQTGGMPAGRPVGPSVMAASGPGFSPAPPQQAQAAASPPQMGQQGLRTPGGENRPALTWQSVMNAIVKRAPPGTPPERIAGAVNAAIPLMNAQSQEEWRHIQAQMTGLRAQQLQGGAVLQPQDEARAQAIAEGRAAPITGYAGTRGEGSAIMRRVYEINPGYDVKSYASDLAGARVTGATDPRMQQQVLKDFSGTGPAGKSIVAFNTFLNHTDLALKVFEAAKNGDISFINSIRNQWRTMFGSEIPTNINAVMPFVSTEMIKSVQGTAGALADREEAQQILGARWQSPEQFPGAINQLRSLALGALESRETQWNGANMPDRYGNFDRWLTPQSKKLYQQYKKGTSEQGSTGQGATPGGSGGWSGREIK